MKGYLREILLGSQLKLKFDRMYTMKKLYRSKNNKIFAGILGGLGEYYNVDPVLLRLIWVFFLIMSGVIPGLIVYVIALIVVPERKHDIEHE